MAGPASKGVVHKTRIIVLHVEYQDADQNLGNEIGQEHHCLRHLLEPFALHLIEQDGDKYSQQISQKDERQIIKDRVLRQLQKLSGLDQELEILKPHERTSENPFSHVIPDECHIDSR